MVKEFIWERRIIFVLPWGGGILQTIPKGLGKGRGLEGRRRGHSQTKWQHTITGTTDITDTAEGAG